MDTIARPFGNNSSMWRLCCLIGGDEVVLHCCNSYEESAVVVREYVGMTSVG